MQAKNSQKSPYRSPAADILEIRYSSFLEDSSFVYPDPEEDDIL